MRYIIAVFILFFYGAAFAQTLKPGFDPVEYEGLLERSAGRSTFYVSTYIPKETNYDLMYSSPEMGLHNKWALWENKEKTIIVVNIRGTVGTLDSWLENLYSAMIPAVGSIKLTNAYTFNYKFASDPRAMVHIGWAIGVGAMAPDILDKIQRAYAQGVKQIIVEGHSQGGVLALLLTAYLHYQVQDGKLPKDIVIKSYCSAAPKPGNLNFAYDYENATTGGWSFTVVNAADWVPETPFSIQTVNDFNKVNPFVHVKEAFRKQKFIVRVLAGHVYHRMSKSTVKAQRKFDKYLGKILYKRVKKFMPEYEQPAYTTSFNYMRAGTPIVFEPGEDYYKQFPDTGSNIFRNHLFEPYYYLVKNAYK